MERLQLRSLGVECMSKELDIDFTTRANGSGQSCILFECRGDDHLPPPFEHGYFGLELELDIGVETARALVSTLAAHFTHVSFLHGPAPDSEAILREDENVVDLARHRRS